MMRKLKKVVAILMAAVLLVSCTVDHSSLSGSRPNIILIMADDLGFSDLAMHGNTLVETPHLDRFASESVQFSQFYVSPVCATTRASLLTGRQFLRTGVSHVHGGKDFLHLDEFTLADALKEAGYSTGMWGKWHSGKTPGYFPWERGFDEAYMARLYQHKDNVGLYNGVLTENKGWVTETICDYAIDFIQRNRDHPFFAYLPLLTCHAPLNAPELYTKKYLDKGLSENLSTLYGMVDHMDFQLGRLFYALDEMGLSENTIVLFLSDNGPAVINDLLTNEDRKIRYVNKLRGHKGNIWENGIKSPLFVKWKGTLSPTMADGLADVTDLFPTLLELAGVEQNEHPNKLDGTSILPLLSGSSGTDRGKEIFLYANPGWPPTDKAWTPEGVKDEYRPWKFSGGDNLLYENQIIGIREDTFKLLLNPGPTDGSIEPDESGYVLLDVRKDPRERKNLVEDYPELASNMKAKLKSWHKDIYSSEHAFEMPEFQVGTDTAQAYSVLAYGPQHSSQGVKSAHAYISGFKAVGDSATYLISVDEKGIYKMEISYLLEGASKMNFDLVFPDYTFPVEFVSASGAVQISGIPLSSGITSFAITNRSDAAQGEIRLFEMQIAYQDAKQE
ncbi:MAG: sulfatase-like hydrolase/transferase [Bacteroides sp.]|nr:sulfatase-like hydrolase/transferase [Bacteroides sp.]